MDAMLGNQARRQVSDASPVMGKMRISHCGLN
jgi:hypothetical protein